MKDGSGCTRNCVVIDRGELTENYLGWIEQLVVPPEHQGQFGKLIRKLFSIPFIPACRNDENRAENGWNLRYRFLYERGLPYDFANYISPSFCSVLELMTRLAVCCEEEYMCNPAYGDRTSRWFWEMLRSLGLDWVTDYYFDEGFVDTLIDRFQRRDYRPNGSGGLFTLRCPVGDMRDYDIWHQFCLYVDEKELGG